MDINYNEVARLHTVWRNMMSRCFNEANKQYSDYGGRGIFVVDEWLDFHNFCMWALANGSSADLQLYRQDNDGPYASWNCKFVTRQVNARNTRRNRWVEAFGERKVLADWESDPRATTSACNIRRRLDAGWTPEEAITVPRARSRQSGFRKCGHPRDDEHSYRRGNGYRVCKPCALERAKKGA